MFLVSNEMRRKLYARLFSLLWDPDGTSAACLNYLTPAEFQSNTIDVYFWESVQKKLRDYVPFKTLTQRKTI